jgi:hypothetical protein
LATLTGAATGPPALPEIRNDNETKPAVGELYLFFLANSI